MLFTSDPRLRNWSGNVSQMHAAVAAPQERGLAPVNGGGMPRKHASPASSGAGPTTGGRLAAT